MLRLAVAGLLAILVTGCISPSGGTVEEKRQAVQKMRSETLAELYEIHPEAQSQINQAVGYGVFSNVGVNLILFSAGSGWGIVRNSQTGRGMRSDTSAPWANSSTDRRAIRIFWYPVTPNLLFQRN